MAEITPALSRTEWEAKQAVRDGMGISVDAEDDSILCADGRGQEASVMASGRHALAALALHGQPFGFSHDGLLALREVLANFRAFALARGGDNPALVAQYYDAALREVECIAALLPEEEANG